MRITREEMWLRVAEVVALRGTCMRLRVGAVITDDTMTKVLAVGYNGNAAGLPNECDSQEEGKCGCIHAELNALLKGHGGHVIFTTVAPCLSCAKVIINSGITVVYYREGYRSTEGVELLLRAGVLVFGPSHWQCCGTSSNVVVQARGRPA